MSLYATSPIKFVNQEVFSDNTAKNYTYCRFSAKQWQELDENTQKEMIEKISAFISQDDKPLAVILTAKDDFNDAFNESKNYFITGRNQLLKNNYTIIQIDDIQNPEEIETLLKSTQKKIDFFLI